MRFAIIVLLLATIFTFAGDNRSHKSVPQGPCCLCACMSSDQSKCSNMCINLQHSKQIVEEPTIRVCTRTCVHHGVPKLPPNYFVPQAGK